MQASLMNSSICSNHEECEGRSSQIKLTKGFSAKESVKGHMASSFFFTKFKCILFSKEAWIRFCNKKQVGITELAGECSQRIEVI